METPPCPAGFLFVASADGKINKLEYPYILLVGDAHLLLADRACIHESIPHVAGGIAGRARHVAAMGQWSAWLFAALEIPEESVNF